VPLPGRRSASGPGAGRRAGAEGRSSRSIPSGFAENFLQRLDIAFLLLFPYLLHRFTTVFRSATSRLESALGLMTVAMIVWTFALPHFPEPGEPRSAGFIAYLVGFLIHWTVLSSVAATRLWRAGRGQPAVARRRMRILAFAAALLTIALFAAAATSQTYSVLALVSSALGIVSALAFLVALAPPAVVRMIWRRPAQERVQDAVRDLITLSRSQAEVATRVLGPMADIVGARALCIRTTKETWWARTALAKASSSRPSRRRSAIRGRHPFGLADGLGFPLRAVLRP
jgi:hypothetical protein